MKRHILFTLLVLTLAAASAYIHTINIGTTPGDHTGDTLRNAGMKMNSNTVALAEAMATNRAEVLSADFGVVGGAGVDEAARLQSLFDWVTNRGPYHLIVRSLNTNDPIRLDSMVTLRASNVRVTFRSPVLLSSNAALVIAGTWGVAQTLNDSPDELGNPATTNNWRVTVSNADAYPTGCVVKVATTETETDITTNAVTTSGLRYTNVARCEIKRVMQVNGDYDYLTFDTPLVDGPYRPGAPTNATVQILNVVSNSSFEGLNITWREDGNPNISAAIHLTNVFRCKVIDCTVNGIDGQAIDAIRVEYGLECEVNRCTVENAKAQNSASGYGITVYQSDRTRILNCISAGNRHNYVVQKANHTEIGFCKSYNEGISGFDVHGVRSFFTHIHDCAAVGGQNYKGGASNKALIRVGNTSHAGGDFFTLIENCVMSGAWPTNGNSSSLANYAGLDVHTPCANVTIKGNTFTGCRTGIRIGNMDQFDTPVYDVVISGNTFTRVTNPFNIVGNISGSNEVRRLVLDNNTILSSTNHIKLKGVTDLVLGNNRILNVAGTGFRAIDLTSCTNVSVIGNVSVGAAAAAVFTTCGNVYTNGNNFQ